MRRYSHRAVWTATNRRGLTLAQNLHPLVVRRGHQGKERALTRWCWYRGATGNVGQDVVRALRARGGRSAPRHAGRPSAETNVLRCWRNEVCTAGGDNARLHPIRFRHIDGSRLYGARADAFASHHYRRGPSADRTACANGRTERESGGRYTRSSAALSSLRDGCRRLRAERRRDAHRARSSTHRALPYRLWWEISGTRQQDS